MPASSSTSRKCVFIFSGLLVACTTSVIFDAAGKSWKSTDQSVFYQLLLWSLIINLGIVHCFVFLAVYRITIHPLAIYPGPFLAALTDWYNIYHCLGGDRHLLFYDLHRKYGPIVRFGPNRISFNSVQAMKDIYGVQSNTQKSKVYTAYSHFFKVPSVVTTIEKKAHAIRRRINVRALTPAAVKGLEYLIIKNSEIFLDSIKEENSTPQELLEDNQGWGPGRNMSKWISWLMSDIMGDVTFSRNWNLMKSEKNRHIVNVLSLGACLINTSGHMPFLLNLGLDKVFLRRLMKGTHDFEALSKEQSDWRISNSEKLSQKDLFTALLEARDPDTGHALTTEELIAEAGILIVAGTDTTATSLTATIFYLVHYPDALSRVKEEVRKQFASMDDIRIGKELSSCKFLFACFDEAMRLSPGVGAILQREILRGGLMVDGHMLPEGTDVGISAYCIHHNHIYFPEPFDFKPERWLADDLAPAYSAFTPFGVGRTSCVGKYLAYQEMAIVLARMVWVYDMRVQPGTRVGEGFKELGKGRQRKNEFQTYEKFVSSHDGPIVQFRKRNGASEG